MILITGTTGHLGKSVVESLLQKTPASHIAVLVRDPSRVAELKSRGIDVRIGDYNDYNSLIEAFEGIDKLYFVSGNDVANRGKQHENVVRAAREAGINHVIYTSFQRKNETDSSPIVSIAKAHIDTEKLLKESGLAFTILKHNIYMDMLPLFMGEKVLETGTIFLPAGDGKISFALRDDMAEAGAYILASEGHENRSYEISGGISYSFNDIAGILTDITNKKVVYMSPSRDVYVDELRKAGVPDEYILTFAGFSEGFRQGEFDLPDNTLEKLLGRKPVSLRDYLKKVYVSEKVS